MRAITESDLLSLEASYDLIVIGAGGAGMAAALFGALAGARVLLTEHTELVGGSTAFSAGSIWVPLTHHAATVNPTDTLEAATAYLDHVVGAQSSAVLRAVFLRYGPETIAELEDKTDVRLRPYAKHPDYQSEAPGSTLRGRALEPVPFDARVLGPLFGILRPPIPEFTVLGGMMVDRIDIGHLLAMKRSWTSFVYSMRILARYLVDRLRYPRGTRLVMGNALAGRLLYSLSQHPNVTLALGASLHGIERDAAGRVVGATLVGASQRDKSVRIAASRGVVLSSGGFSRDVAMRAARMPGIDVAWYAGAPGNTGDAQARARALGAAEGSNAATPAFWTPMSLRRRADGSTAVFPHFVMDRAKPGVITVNSAGRRILNESASYHLFGLDMQAAHRDSPSIPSFMIADARALQRYGLGIVRPGGGGLDACLADGYVVRGDTLTTLAHQLGIDGVALEQTVARWNEHARRGVDPDFHRGETPYQHNLGDASAGHPNPNLGPLDQPPYYALRLYPGEIGAAQGLSTDEHARVLNANGAPIEGLYAVGADMNSIMGGAYPGPGITLGPAIVFARLAARHALRAGREPPRPDSKISR